MARAERKQRSQILGNTDRRRFNHVYDERLKASGLTATALAIEMGLSLNTLRAIRMGTKGVDKQSILTACTYFGLDLDSMGQLEDPPPKALARSKTISQSSRPILPAAVPSHRTSDTKHNNFLRYLDNFIGRKETLAAIGNLMGEARLLTLTGSGGVGKTRLSLEVAAYSRDNYADGVWFVDLAALADSSQLSQYVASVLHIREHAGQSLARTLIDYLEPKHLLLVLDNCEHLRDDCAHLAATMLRSCPNIHILATSRERLYVSGEQVYIVPPLSFPDPKQVQDLDTLSQYDSVHLFIERARSFQPDFSITNVNAPTLAQICQRLDGIPLAIELAAALVPYFSLAEIAMRLDNGPQFLALGSATMPARHRSFREIIAWSYNLLSQPERRLFVALSVFQDAWTLSDAVAVCATDGDSRSSPDDSEAAERFQDFADLPRQQIHNLLIRLIDKSLVIFDKVSDGSMRFRLQESIRWFANDVLSSPAGQAERERLRVAHANWQNRIRTESTKPSETEPPSPDEILRADRAEEIMRRQLSSFDFVMASANLREIIQLDPTRKERLINEFGFLLATVGADNELCEGFSGGVERRKWLTTLWKFTALGNNFLLPELVIRGASKVTDVSLQAENVPERHALQQTKAQTAEQKGEELEIAVTDIFRNFFQSGDDLVWKLNRQLRGAQHGYDLGVEFSRCALAWDERTLCHIECKNVRDTLTLKEVADKLLVEATRNVNTLDHWIVIAPHAEPAAELTLFLEKQEQMSMFPFRIHLWTRNTGLAELFGLKPEVYDLFYTPQSGEEHPSKWDDARCKAIVSKWREPLARPLRMPKGWADYLRQPRMLCIHQEKPEEYEALWANHVPLRGRNSAGTLLERPLLETVEKWLQDPKTPILVLLGEFGDGKSFFTYGLARKLAQEYRRSPKAALLPLRLALREYPGNARDFLRSRLEEFDADVGGWRKLNEPMRSVVILDGFDEISSEVGPDGMGKNARVLLDCVQQFAGAKILITSRTPFFQNHSQVKHLAERLGTIVEYHVARIPRAEVDRHLSTLAKTPEQKQVLQRMRNMSDPLDLGSKPLFLQMLKEEMEATELPTDFNEITIYERHIRRALERKFNYWNDPHLQTSPAETMVRLRKLLTDMALHLQRTGEAFVQLQAFAKAADLSFAELLWRYTHPTEEEELDTQARFEGRSLLAQVTIGKAETGQWPVDFCHRSIREYFVADSLAEAVVVGVEEATEFLQTTPTNHEIRHFAAQMLRKKDPSLAQERLLGVIERISNDPLAQRFGGVALTLLYRILGELPKNFDWRDRALDGAELEGADLSGLDFSGSSFQGAIFANVNLEDANLSRCNLLGAHLEETQFPLAVTALPGGDRLAVTYNDGTIREWKLLSGGRAELITIGQHPEEPRGILGLDPWGHPWIRTGQEWISFVPNNGGEWQIDTRFPLHHKIKQLHVDGMRMLWVETSEAGVVELRLVDLEEGGLLASLPIRAPQHLRVLYPSIAVWHEQNEGLRVLDLETSEQRIDLNLPCAEPSVIAVSRIGEGALIVGCGFDSGRLQVWRIDSGAVHPTMPSLILDADVHSAPVTCLAILDEDRIVSGGGDRLLAVTRLGQPESVSRPMVEYRLVQTLRCRGLRIDGLEGLEEYRALNALIAKA